MNELFQQLMADAARSTRQGRLTDATQAIQRALLGRGDSPPFRTEAASPAFRQPGPPDAGNSSVILDGLVRVVENPAADKAPRADPVGHARWLRASFSHQGRTLAYRLYLPPTAAGAAVQPPLVVMLHGCTQDADDFAVGTQMNARAGDLGVAVLYPEQVQRANAQKCWNWFKPQHQRRGRGEPAFIAALAQSVTAEHGLDAARVYVAGLSAGGAMADIVGQTYPDVFAAVGVHSGLPQGCATDVMSALSVMRSGSSASTTAALPRASALPTIVFHGDADSTVHISNGQAIAEAVSHAGASAGPHRATQGRSQGGARHTCTTTTDASGRVTTEFWQLHQAGHAWSGGSAEGSYTHPQGVDASAEMLRFFLAHPRTH